ncbi:MAG: pantoate--beta-alanine ligase [Anaerolineales bacterium]|jgi:pantoate--beta-alanine ligase|nr:pantoate--beta-alanine ligase [Anaerolineales bacterium]
MKTVCTLLELRSERDKLLGSVGLVPTMGFLHRGHISLVQAARAQNANVAVSIFVNPTQFAMGEDLEDYPRDLDRDLAVLEAEGVDLVWTPDIGDVYPSGYQTYVSVEQITRGLEGARRPSYMRGVTTVVTKLFIAFTPDRAYFGQKDVQQVYAVRRMVSDLGFPVKVVVCPTVREPDGLALSSRNTYLSSEQRQASTVLFSALSAAHAAFAEGQRDGDKLRALMADVIASEQLAVLQYVSVADLDTLEELQQLPEKSLASLAVLIGEAVLIDNMLLGEI